MKPLSLIVSLVFAAFPLPSHAQHWYKGNTHAHSLWSDGDALPEVVVDWHKKNGYHFLALSEHNIFAGGGVERWYPVGPEGALSRKRVEQAKREFGADTIQEKVQHGRAYVRLKTVDELKKRFEQKGKFLLVPGEEITSVIPGVHVNAFNIRELLPAVNFVTPTEAFIANLDFVAQHGERHDIPVLAHVNHPNWQDGYSAETVVPIEGPLVFEIYNGHPGVRNWGDKNLHMVSTDRFWDIVLTLRLERDRRNVLYGVAVGDSHEYFEFRTGNANPGRGWIMVRANELTPKALVNAIHAGDFYATSGVILSDIRFDGRQLTIEVDAEDEVSYTTQFIGTRKGFDPRSTPATGEKGVELPDKTRTYSKDIGKVFHETTDNPAVYNLRGDELYVRARVLSTKEQPNPFMDEDQEIAWTQPVQPR